MKRVLIKKLNELEEMLRTNAAADWSENDPSEEFAALADIVKAALPTDRDHAIDELSHLICDDDVSEAYDRLLAQSEIDGSVDAWDFVTIWQPFENDGWTVDDLLGRIM
jgi:hypothetical protein